jgi:hypothetical protein
MDTSKAIKSRQYDPIEPVQVLDGGWRMVFDSETRDRVQYTTVRDRRHPRQFKCGCPARGLCKHITRMVQEFARPRYEAVSVWTSEGDADRQRRRDLTLYANGNPFHVTYGRRRLALDNPDVKGVASIGAWVSADTEVIFEDDTTEIVPGLDLYWQAERRGWMRAGFAYWRPKE